MEIKAIADGHRIRTEFLQGHLQTLLQRTQIGIAQGNEL